jgi:hypothetical protein
VFLSNLFVGTVEFLKLCAVVFQSNTALGGASTASCQTYSRREVDLPRGRHQVPPLLDLARELPRGMFFTTTPPPVLKVQV